MAVKILTRNFNIESVLMAVSPLGRRLVLNRLHLLRRNRSPKRATTVEIIFALGVHCGAMATEKVR
jgi:hypothetical protein